MRAWPSRLTSSEVTMPARGRPGWAGPRMCAAPAPIGPISAGLRRPGERPACLLRTGGCSLRTSSQMCSVAPGAASPRPLDQAAPLLRVPGAGRACEGRAGLRQARACDRAEADKARGRRKEHAPRPAAVGAQLAQECGRERRRRVYVRRWHLPACTEARRRAR